MPCDTLGRALWALPLTGVCCAPSVVLYVSSTVNVWVSGNDSVWYMTLEIHPHIFFSNTYMTHAHVTLTHSKQLLRDT